VSYYLDTSAAVKLVKRELESDALVAFLQELTQTPSGGTLVAGDILRTELVAAVLRAGMPLSAAMAVLDSVYLVRLTGSLCEAAGSLAGEFGLRSLDALHLAVAVSMRNSIHGVITYDQRFAEAASKLGFVVETP
jgi:predicted nucleic acid-binding protein